MPPSLWHSVKASNQEAFPELSRNEDSPKEIQVSEQLSVEACGGGEGGGLTSNPCSWKVFLERKFNHTHRGEKDSENMKLRGTKTATERE